MKSTILPSSSINRNPLKVLLVQPNFYSKKKGLEHSGSPPLGLLYIAGLLEENSIDVEILDANATNRDIEFVIQYALETKATVVGVSIMMIGYNFGVEIAQRLPNYVLSVAGGAYASTLPEEVLKDGFDISVKGRGEYTMLDILSNDKIEAINGISYWKGGETVHNPPRRMKSFKDEPLPKPARHLLVNNGVDKPYQLAGTMYYPWSPVFSSIGCPYQCYYCSKQVFDRFLSRDPEDVVEEIRCLVENYKVREIVFFDDCFNASIERAERILDLIIASNMEIKLRFPNGIRANNVTQKLIRKMKKAGCIAISYGIESGEQSILDKIPKKVKLEEIRKAVKYTKEAGILTIGFFILGLLGDTKETMQKTIDFAKELELDVAFFSILTPYRGTRIHDFIKEKGTFHATNLDDMHQSVGKMLFSHPDFPSVDLVEKMHKKAYREMYLNPKYICRRFLALKNWKGVILNIKGFLGFIKTQIN